MRFAQLLLALFLLTGASQAPAQAFDDAAFSTEAFSEEAFSFEACEGEECAPGAVGTIGGTAVDALGRMITELLGAAEPVPATAVFIAGIAHKQDGTRYVAEWPSGDVVVTLRQIALRPDGAMIVATSGTAIGTANGWRLTGRGEVLVSESTPVNFPGGGFGTNASGYLSVTEGP